MSTIKENIKVKTKVNEYKVNVEAYMSADEVVRDCENREVRIPRYKMDGRSYSKSWEGVDSYKEALDLLRNGYQPVVDSLMSAMKANSIGNGKRISFENNVHGFAPVVPLALKGVPNSMVNMTMKPIKCKVIDVYYDMTASCGTDPEEMIKAGQKLLGAIIGLEKQGYRFNLYAIQSYTGYENTVDVLCVKVKSSDKPIDLKRISFPLTHPAYFRVIGFDWQGKSPVTRDIGGGRGCALSYDLDDEDCNKFAKTVFGDNAVYFACTRIMKKSEEYLKEVMAG